MKKLLLSLVLLASVAAQAQSVKKRLAISENNISLIVVVLQQQADNQRRMVMLIDSLQAELHYEQLLARFNTNAFNAYLHRWDEERDSLRRRVEYLEREDSSAVHFWKTSNTWIVDSVKVNRQYYPMTNTDEIGPTGIPTFQAALLTNVVNSSDSIYRGRITVHKKLPAKKKPVKKKGASIYGQSIPPGAGLTQDNRFFFTPEVNSYHTPAWQATARRASWIVLTIFTLLLLFSVLSKKEGKTPAC